MNPHRLSTLSLVFAATLAACGGGGGGGASVAPPPTAGAPGAAPGAAPIPAPAPSPGAAPSPAPPPSASADGSRDVIVQLNTGQPVAALAAAYGLSVLDQFGKRPIWRLRLAPGASLDSALAALRADSRVRVAEANVESQTPEGRQESLWAVGGDARSYAVQWAPSALRLPQAHALSLGTGVRVAVLDTGIDRAHPALADRLARTGTGELLGRDFVDDDADPSEAGVSGEPGYGHGTHVAGLVTLVAPQAQLMPVRVLDRAGRGNVWVLAEALAWAADPDANPATDDGAHVINLSLGTTQPTTLLRTAVALADCDFDDDDDEFDDPGYDDDKRRCANKFGAVVLAAAGNDGRADRRQFPAAEEVPGSVAVTAHTEQRRLAGFANTGSWVEVAAPGERIISTFPGGGYATWSGTSMAAPLAAGTAALVLATFADKRAILPPDVAQRLLARTAALCGGTSLRGIDAAAAVSDTQAPEPACN